MRRLIVVAGAVVLAALLPASVVAAASGAPATSGPAAAVPAGYPYSAAASQQCVTVAPTALAHIAGRGLVPILAGVPGQPAEWCWGQYARETRAGLRLPNGGVGGEWLTPAEYAALAGHSVAVVHAPDGLTALYVY